MEWLRLVNSSLPSNVLLLWAVLLLVNVPAPLLGLTFDDDPPQLWYQPPGWVIPSAWFVVFALLATARWRLLLLDPPGASAAAALIIWLAVSCAAYAHYTLGLAQPTGISALTLAPLATSSPLPSPWSLRGGLLSCSLLPGGWSCPSHSGPPLPRPSSSV